MGYPGYAVNPADVLPDPDDSTDLVESAVSSYRWNVAALDMVIDREYNFRLSSAEASALRAALWTVRGLLLWDGGDGLWFAIDPGEVIS